MDFAQISEALALASSAVGLTGKAASTAEAIKGLLASDKPVDSGEAAKLLNSLASELTAANMSNVQLSESLKVLSRELQKDQEFEKEKARYELWKTGEGAIVFKLREEMANGQPIHFICPVCLNRDKLISFVTGEGDFKCCQTDRDHVFRFKDTPIQQPGRSERFL